MSDNRDPPPLFFPEDDSPPQSATNSVSTTAMMDSDCLFESALQSVPPPEENGTHVPSNMLEEEIDLNDDEDKLSPVAQSLPVSVKKDISALEDDEKTPFADMTQAPKLQITQDRGPELFAPLSSGLLRDTEENTKAPNEEIQITVTEPQKMSDGMSAYVLYRVTTKTTLQIFKQAEFTVLRRFSDFLGLHEKLVHKYLRAGRIIPPTPEKSVIGMTKIKMSNADQGTQNEFVEKRRASLERFLNRTAAHPVLRIDPDFREFLEETNELPKATSTSALSGAGVMRLFNKVGETVNKITYKMDESDPWFEEKVQQIENLDCQLRKLHGSIESLVQQRKELAMCTASFASSAAMLSNCEEHTSLSRALSQLAEVEEKMEQLHNEQANADFSLLSELMKDYIALIGAVKDVFHERVKVFQTWQHAQQTLTKKRELKAKLELAGKHDKITQAREEVVEWESKVERGQEEFQSISEMIKKEMDHFELNRIKDFKAVIVKYLESLVNHQMQLIVYWEAFLPEAKAVA